MEQQHYQHLFNYLNHQQTPDYFDNQQKRQLIKQSSNYTLSNNLLYKVHSKNNQKLLRVPTKSELPALLI